MDAQDPVLARLVDQVSGAHAHQTPLDIRGGGTKLGRIICRSATLHSQTASSLSSPN